jgi:hypothetical protein
MKFTKFFALLFGIAVLSVVSARATRIGSSYGTGSGFVVTDDITTSPNWATAVVCSTSTSCSPGTDYDLLVAITSPALDNASFSVTVPTLLTTAPSLFSNNGPNPFGVFECTGGGFSNGIVTDGAVTFCTSATEASSLGSLQCATSSGSTVTVSGACVQDGATFYFDESSPGSPTPNFSGTGTTPVPEPSTFALMLTGLLTVGIFLTRRARA